MRVKTALIALVLASWAPSASAILKARENAEHAQQELTDAKAHQADLADQDKKQEAELAAIRKKLLPLAQTISDNEKELASSEEALRVLNEQLSDRQQALASNRAHLTALVDAALKVSRMPPEAMVMMPGDAKQTMQAARALKMASGSIKQELTDIGIQIDEMQKLQDKIRTHQDAIRRNQNSLAKEKTKLEAELAQRSKLQAGLKQQEGQEAEKTADLAKRAQNLSAAVATIERSEKPISSRQSLRNVGKGRFSRPAAGKIVKNFGQGDSKGLTIATPEDAQVVAPFDGEVVFAGTFLNYGKMVILRHSNGFHTLLAGLANIDARPGEFLLEGEPIGAMGDREPFMRLYVELRKDNQPIDPAPWMKKE